MNSDFPRISESDSYGAVVPALAPSLSLPPSLHLSHSLPLPLFYATYNQLPWVSFQAIISAVHVKTSEKLENSIHEQLNTQISLWGQEMALNLPLGLMLF